MENKRPSVYLAAAYRDREKLLPLRAALQDSGVDVTSRWLNGAHDLKEIPQSKPVDEYTPLTDEEKECIQIAREDLEDIARADGFVAFTYAEGTPGAGRGGRQVELGYALALGKRVIRLGPLEHVFHSLIPWHGPSGVPPKKLATDIKDILETGHLHGYPPREAFAPLTIHDLVMKSAQTALEHGWWEGSRGFADTPEKIALMHSELSEALEEYRNAEAQALGEIRKGEGGKPEGLVVELADVIIRIADFCGYLSLDLEAALLQKMGYNHFRTYKHGNKRV